MNIVIKSVVTFTFGIALAMSAANAATVVKRLPTSKNVRATVETVSYAAAQAANRQSQHVW